MDMYGFVDEYGTSELDTSKDGVSSCFVITCVIVKDDNLEKFKAQSERIRSLRFQKGEMKSSKIGRKHKRRLLVLKDIMELPCTFYALVVDKDRIEGHGLGYKKTSLKFFHKILFDEIITAYPSLKISLDEHGSKPFMKGFIDYLERRIVQDGLFSATEFQYLKSSDSKGIQVADIISGTIGYIYDKKKSFPLKKEAIEAFGQKVIGIKEWPFIYDHSKELQAQGEEIYDSRIAGMGVRLAQKYIKDFESKKEPIIEDRVRCLYRLLYHFIYVSKAQFLPRYVLMESIMGRSSRKISQHYFRTRIIAKLRDAGVIIVSSRNGYKLPTSQSDISGYLLYSGRVVKPMMSRIGKVREKILLLTHGEYDILEDEEYEAFRSYLEVFKTIKTSDDE